MNKLIDRICDVMAFIAAGILCFLAGLTFFDVFGRRFFDAPITGTIEIVEVGVAIAAFFAMPRAFLTNTHVSAQFLEILARGTFGAIITVLRGSLMVGILSILTYATSLKAIELMGGYRATIELEIPFFPIKVILAVAMGVSVVAAFVWMIRAYSSTSLRL